MGKRKFKKPDDSESEYEWEEAKPTKIIESTSKNSNSTDLEGFLNQYSTKSLCEIRSDKVQSEKNAESKLYEDRIYKVSESSSKNRNNDPKCDIKWLKKSFQRCKEHANSEGIDFMILLRDRYDENTVDFMLRKFRGWENEGRSEVKHNFRQKITHNEQKNELESDQKITEERYVTNADINEASALLLKAEMSGNSGKITKLKKRLETLREAEKRNLKVRLTRLKKEPIPAESQSSFTMIEKHLKTGKMIPYFECGSKFVSQSSSSRHNDDNIGDLLRQELAIDGEENDLEFAKMSSKTRSRKNNAEAAAESEYSARLDAGGNKKSKIAKTQNLDKQNAIKSHKFHSTQINNCRFCRSGSSRLPKHLVVCKGDFFSLLVPAHQSIVDFHCQLVPLDHIGALTHLTADGDAWDELNRFKRQIVAFFTEQFNSETVFMETVLELKSFPHTVIDCVPLSRSREMAEISSSVFFRKSMDEAKSEWSSSNGKVIELKASDIRRTVPKGFAYFSVEFDYLSGGFAVVIEDERKFERDFGWEIVGSLLGKNLVEIRNGKNREKTFKEQADGVLRFEKKWKSYNLWINDSSDEEEESD